MKCFVCNIDNTGGGILAGHCCIRCWYKIMPLQRSANSKVRWAVRTGKLTPASLHKCKCGKNASQYDHRDYMQPLMVTPVCASCNTRMAGAIQHRSKKAFSIALKFLESKPPRKKKKSKRTAYRVRQE